MAKQDGIETVADLVAALLRQPQGAKVGITLSRVNGWVNGVGGLMVAEDGTVCVDQADSTVHADEVGLLPAP